MINVTALNRLLTENADGKIFRRWFITTPNGSLVAYTTPADIRQLRDQAALVLVTWREQADALVTDANGTSTDPETPTDSPTSSSTGSRMHTMTMEFDNRNVLVRKLQPKLLLVLEGGVPPGRSRQLQITVEGADGVRRFTDVESNGAQAKSDEMVTPPPGSPNGHSETSTTRSSKRRSSVLDVHRKRIDELTEVIQQDFAEAHFSMPADSDDYFF